MANKLWWAFWPSESAAAELDGSLGRMGFDVIDLAYSAPLPTGLPVEDPVAAIGALIAAGKLRAWVTVNWPPSSLAAAVRASADQGVSPPCATQLPYNLVHRRAVGLSPGISGNAIHAYPVVGPPPTCPLPQPPPTNPIRFTCPLWSTPIDGNLSLAGGSLYVPTTTDGLVVLDAATGPTRWTAPTNSAVTVPPAVAGGVVYVGQDSGRPWAFDAAGRGSATCTDPLWKVRTGASITGAPAVNQGRLYVGTADDRLLAFGLPAG